MMHITYSPDNPLPRQGAASRMLRRVSALNQAPGKLVYWLTAITDFGPTRVPLLPHEGPAVAQITYRLRLAFCPTRPVAAPGNPASLGQPLGLEASVASDGTTGPKQALAALAQSHDRNYLIDQQQAIYDELVASYGPTPEGLPLALLPYRLPLSVAEITRELAGWTTPEAETLRGEQKAAPKRGKKAYVKSRNN